MFDLHFSSFLLLAITIVSVWFTKNTWVHSALLAVTTLLALYTNITSYQGLLFLALLIFLWIFYLKDPEKKLNGTLFLIIVLYSTAFKLHLVPGFNNIQIDSKFFLSFDSTYVGTLPLLFVTPLTRKLHDWKPVFTKGLLITFLGLGIMIGLALISGTVKLQFKIPSYPFLRYFNNLIFVSIAEEALYRGFIQNKLIDWLQKIQYKKYIALFLTALIFTFTHWFWAPDIGTFIFVFLAGLLYGYVYVATERIESAVICHFLLNFIHMTFFTYHAM